MAKKTTLAMTAARLRGVTQSGYVLPRNSGDKPKPPPPAEHKQKK